MIETFAAALLSTQNAWIIATATRSRIEVLASQASAAARAKLVTLRGPLALGFMRALRVAHAATAYRTCMCLPPPRRWAAF